MRAVFLLSLFVLAGCATPGPGSEDGDAGVRFTACAHPWPCGDEWPEGLVGPFEVVAEPVAIAMSDGVTLAGWVHRPVLPDGVRAPVVLYATPYMASCKHPIQTGGEPECDPDGDDLEGQSPTLGERLGELAPRGFALLLVSVRGTGLSGGCFDLWGPTEERDMVELVEWAAAQPWSNGRVGMYGVSYMGTTPFEAAVAAPEALKTIVVAGVITDVYQVQFSPQGAPITFGAATHFEGGFAGMVTGAPPVAAPQALPSYLANLPQRACGESARHQSAFEAGSFGADRDASYFGPRNYALRLPNVTASILVAQGLDEGSVHGRQDDIIWEAATRAPKRFILGQWGHQFPGDEHLEAYSQGTSWMDVAGPWLDFWLKGIGSAPPGLGAVDVQRSDGAWMRSTAWPPPEASDRAAYLTAEGFAAAPGAQPLAFTALVHPQTPTCSTADDAIVVSTPPLEEDLVLVGNPMAQLVVESDRPAGTLHLYLAELDGEGCDATATILTQASADLRFHAGTYAAADFPVGEPTPVRFDFWGIAHVVPAGRRLALVVDGPGDSFGAPGARVTLHPESHVVLPVVAGPLEAGEPLAEYPPRPFAP